MGTGFREPYDLSQAEDNAVVAMLNGWSPDLADEWNHGWGTAYLIQQSYFRNHRLIRLAIGRPPHDQSVEAALDKFCKAIRLTGSLEAWNAIVEGDPPAIGKDLESRRAYIFICDETTSSLGPIEFQVDAFDEIPWLNDLTAEEQAKIQRLRQTLGRTIRPPIYEETDHGFCLSRWLMVSRKLIYRVTEVETSGKVKRTDETHSVELPTYRGPVWGMADGKLRLVE